MNLNKKISKTKLQLSNYPQDIDIHNWYYEEKSGINLIHQVWDRNSGSYIRTDEIKIPWRKLVKSICRKYNLNADNVFKK